MLRQEIMLQLYPASFHPSSFWPFSRRLAAAALSDTHFIQSYMEGARNANIAKADIDRVEHTWTHSDYTGTKGVGNKYRANRHFDESSHNDLF